MEVRKPGRGQQDTHRGVFEVVVVNMTTPQLSSLNPLTGVVKPPNFDGTAGKFRSWAFLVSNYVGVIDGDLSQAMDNAITSAVPIPLPPGDMDQRKSIWLYALLAGLVRDQAFRYVVNNTPSKASKNGLELWRQFHLEYSPVSGNRKSGLLSVLLRPNFNEDMDDNTWRKEYESWLTLKAEYEAMVIDPLPEEILCCLVISGAPIEIKSQLQFQEKLYEDYKALDATIRRWLGSRRMYDHDHGDDMDVSRVNESGGGKGGRKQLGPCHKCGNMGHLRANCPYPGGGKGGGAGGAQKASTGGKGGGGALHRPGGGQGGGGSQHKPSSSSSSKTGNYALKPFAGGLSSKGAGGGKSKGAGKSKKTVHIVEEGQEDEAEEEWPEEEEQEEEEQTVQRIEGDTSTVWMF